MKKKDIFYLLLAVTILLGTGYVGYTLMFPAKAASSSVEVEKIGSIPTQMDVTGLADLRNGNIVHNFNSPLTPPQGLGNKAVFGQ